MSKIAIIIPSRLKAKRLPNKPLKLINNKEMVLHAYDVAINAKMGEVYVATPDKEIANFCRSIFSVAKKKGILNNGYRIIINCGPDSNQEVPHLHAHVLGGKNLGPMLS